MESSESFLKTAEKNHQSVAIKTTKYPEDVRTKLGSYLKQSIGPFNIFEVGSRNPINRFKNIKHLDYLVLNLSGLPLKEIFKIILVCYDLPIFHSANVTYKLHSYNFNNKKKFLFIA